jgi:hypothetical protein
VPGRKRAPQNDRRVAQAGGISLFFIPRPVWLRAAGDAVDAAHFRADARRNALAVVRVIGWSADRHTGRSRPTLTRIMAATGLSRRTVQNWTRWLERRGFLDVLEPGTTAVHRPALLAFGSGNLAREWRLTVPSVHGSCTPGGSLDLERSPSQARARKRTRMDRRSAPDSPSPPPRPGPQVTCFPSGQNPQRRRDRLAAAESLRRDLPVLRSMTAVAVASACRPYWAAGWTAGDIGHALDHNPDGTAHRLTSAVRSPAHWLAHRLSLWRSADGAVLPGHSADLAARAQAHRAAQAAQREQFAEARAQAADYPARASTARAVLRQALVGRRGTGGTSSASR